MSYNKLDGDSDAAEAHSKAAGKKKDMAKKMIVNNRPHRGTSSHELNKHAKSLGGASARWIGKRGSFTGT